MVHNDDSINVSTSRGIEVDLNFGDFDIIAEYNTTYSCPSTGSSFTVTNGGNVMTSCSTGAPGASGSIQEFDTSGGAAVWEVDLNCAALTYHNGALYRGRPMVF